MAIITTEYIISTDVNTETGEEETFMFPLIRCKDCEDFDKDNAIDPLHNGDPVARCLALRILTNSRGWCSTAILGQPITKIKKKDINND